MAARDTKPAEATTPEAANIFEQYNGIIAQRIVDRVRTLLEGFARPTPNVEQRLFDVEQAATYLGRTPEAVRLLLHRGTLPMTKIDGKVQIDRAALDRVISEATFYRA